jgi:asparagine synthase (glutamine-hydrolysing)
MLREAMRGRIPESVRARVDKMGFPTSAREWFSGPLYERLREVIYDRSFREQGMLRADALSKALEAHRNSAANHSEKLFAAAQFHLWRTQSS